VIIGLGTKTGTVVLIFIFDGCHVPMSGQRPAFGARRTLPNGGCGQTLPNRVPEVSIRFIARAPESRQSAYGHDRLYGFAPILDVQGCERSRRKRTLVQPGWNV
jgi:hypothetical protein